MAPPWQSFGWSNLGAGAAADTYQYQGMQKGLSGHACMHFFIQGMPLAKRDVHGRHRGYGHASWCHRDKPPLWTAYRELRYLTSLCSKCMPLTWMCLHARYICRPWIIRIMAGVFSKLFSINYWSVDSAFGWLRLR